MTLLVKYCGGCNPRYDRGAPVRRVKGEFPQLAVETAVNVGAQPDFVAVVCGCPARCAEHAALNGRCGKIILSSQGDYEELRDLIAQHLPKE